MRVGKINVYLPDDLEAALAPYKGQVNVSRVCAAALREELARMKQLEQTEGTRAALIERLRAQREQASDADFKAGEADAARDVRQLRYAQFRELARIDAGLNYSYGLFNALPTWAREEFEEAERDRDPETDLITDRDAWAQGWLEHVQKAWEELEEAL